MTRTLPLLLALLAPLPAVANDSVAELTTGGLILSRSDAVQMLREDLAISAQAISVDYVFRNQTDQPVDSLVAFPMPPVSGSVDMMVAVPEDGPGNLYGFTVTQDGAAITPQLHQRAEALGLDIGADLAAQNVPFAPYGAATVAALSRLAPEVAADWTRRGLMTEISFDAGQGMQVERVPLWTWQASYWWPTRFAAGQDVRVSHRYTPSVGASAGVALLYEQPGSALWADYQRRYCVDAAFEKALRAAEARHGGQLMEQRIAYVLGTGGNWAEGAIGRFHLTIDKGRPDALVSFCGTGVKKTAPTTFVMEATDYLPPEMLEVLIVSPPPKE